MGKLLGVQATIHDFIEEFLPPTTASIKERQDARIELNTLVAQVHKEAYSSGFKDAKAQITKILKRK